MFEQKDNISATEFRKALENGESIQCFYQRALQKTISDNYLWGNSSGDVIMKLDKQTLSEIIREELNSFLDEAYSSNRSKIKYFSDEAKGLVYIRDKSEGPTEPIPPGFVRTAASLGQGPSKPKRHQMNQVEILISQPGFKAMEDVPVSDPRGAEELQRQMDQVESIYQAAMDRLGPDQPDKNEDWNAWYTWTSQKLQSTESYNYSMGKLKILEQLGYHMNTERVH